MNDAFLGSRACNIRDMRFSMKYADLGHLFALSICGISHIYFEKSDTIFDFNFIITHAKEVMF